jgi:hypothetical protein
MSRRKLPYREGDWFAVPISKNQFVVGRVARMAKRGGVLFGYFFPKLFDEQPNPEELEELVSTGAVVVGRFGDLALIRGNWPVIGDSGTWDRSEWPMPLFGRFDADGNPYKVQYNDDDPSKCLSDRKTTHSEIEGLPDACLMGAGSVENRLRKLLENLEERKKANGY